MSRCSASASRGSSRRSRQPGTTRRRSPWPTGRSSRTRPRRRRRTDSAATAPRSARRSPPTRLDPLRSERPRRGATLEVEIGIGKSGRRAYGFDDIAIVPSRRTRDPEDVDISWEIDAFRFELPLMASAMDGVVSPASAIAIGQLGGVGVLNLEGLWTRYEDPEPLLSEIALLDTDKATLRMQEIYAEPIKEELVGRRIAEIKEAGVTSCASVTPQRTTHLMKAILDAE